MRIEGPVFCFDAGRCILCRRCVGACSDGAITLVADYEVAVRRREDLIIEIEAGDD
jgi:formate hydrogenlyase subunit 6/NADH:ubiquinone oxidoreductase subunit I